MADKQTKPQTPEEIARAMQQAALEQMQAMMGNIPGLGTSGMGNMQAQIMAQMQAAGGTVAGKNDVFHGVPSANLRLLYDVRILYHRCGSFSNRKIGGCCPGGRAEYCVRLRRPVGSREAGARFESTRCQKEKHHAECPALWC